MDFIGPTQVESIGGKRYIFVCVDDYSRFCYVLFLRNKSETFKEFEKLCLKLQKEKDTQIIKIVKIRSDHGREFENQDFSSFFVENGIGHEFLTIKTPQQNSVVERKNRTIQEMARMLINSKSLPQSFWAEAVHTACHIINQFYLRPGIVQTPYEL